MVDLHSEEAHRNHAWAAEKAWESTDKAFAVICGVASAIQPSASARLRSAGVPVLEDVASGLRAFGHLFEWRDARALPPLDPPEPPPEHVRRRWREALEERQRLPESDALRLLSDYGIPTARTFAAADLEGVLGAAGRLGYPVALKTASASHKTDVGGVVLGLEGDEALTAAYAEMDARLGPNVTVQEMSEPGVEMALGVVGDPQFGPLVMVSAGGVLIETLRDRLLALPPLDEARARRLIDRLKSAPVARRRPRHAGRGRGRAGPMHGQAVGAGPGSGGPDRRPRREPDLREPARMRGGRRTGRSPFPRDR